MSETLIYHLMQSCVVCRRTLDDELSSRKAQNGDENSIINWIYDGDRLKTGDDDDDVVTVEDVKRKMEMLHLNR